MTISGAAPVFSIPGGFWAKKYLRAPEAAKYISEKRQKKEVTLDRITVFLQSRVTLPS